MIRPHVSAAPLYAPPGIAAEGSGPQPSSENKARQETVTMIEHLKGYHETVDFKDRPLFRLYHNTEAEDYPPHWHSNPEIIVPLKDIYTVRINDNEYVLQEGDFIYISSACIHHLIAPPDGERLIFQPDYSLLSNLPELSDAVTLMSPATAIRSSEYPELTAKLKAAMLEIEREYFSNSTLSGAKIYSKLLELMVMVGREYAGSAPGFDASRDKQLEYTEKFMGVCEYINEHFSEDLTLDDISEMSGFSKFHFTRLFKQFTGKTFYRYVNIKRIEYAEKLLIDPSTSVTEAAVHSGFSSLPAFVRMFKQIKGCTPTEFRNMRDKTWR